MCAIFYAAESGEHLGLVMPEPGKQKHPRIGSNSSKESLLLFNTFFFVCIHTGNRKWQWQLLHFLLHLSSLLFSVYIALKCSGCLEASWKQLRYNILAFWLSSGIYRIYFTVIFPLLCFIFLLILIDFSLFFSPTGAAFTCLSWQTRICCFAVLSSCNADTGTNNFAESPPL